MRYYGQWMRDEAEKRIGHLYPKIEVTAEMAKERPDLKKYVGQKLTVIAWLWARTVKSPNPAFANVDVPLASTFMLSTKAGKEAYVEPVIEDGGYRFTVKVGKPKDAEAAKNGTKLSRGANFQCLMSGTPIACDYIYGEGKAGRMGARLMAIVAEGERGRVYLAPTPEMEAIALTAQPEWKPEVAMPENPRWFSPPLYGLTTYGDLFTPRQLVALTTFSDLVQEARERVKRDALAAGLPDDGKASATTAALAPRRMRMRWGCILAFAVSKIAELRHRRFALGITTSETMSASLWSSSTSDGLGLRRGKPVQRFERELCLAARLIEAKVDSKLLPAASQGSAHQADAAAASHLAPTRWSPPIRPTTTTLATPTCRTSSMSGCAARCRPVFPDLFATLAVPKAEELVATPYRHGSKEKAETFFLDGMTQAMHRLAEQAHPAFPVTIYYAFKQSESDGDDGTASTGWDTFLAAVIEAGFAISGTWPMRTELRQSHDRIGTNALASSIVLVCRQRAANAPTATRREFVTALKAELPQALAHLQRGNIAPVDLAQAAIGPGMAVYTRYAKVLDAEGKPLSVREALALINQTLDEALAEQEGDFDADTRWALTWFEQTGFAEGEYGVAETALQVQEHQRRRHGRGRHPGIQGAARCACSSPTSCPPTGTRDRHAPHRLGDGASTDPRPRSRRRRCGGGAGREARQPRPKPPANSATASTPCASARSGQPRPWPTTAWCRAGRRSPGWHEKRRALPKQVLTTYSTRNKQPWPSPTTSASARRWSC